MPFVRRRRSPFAAAVLGACAIAPAESAAQEGEIAWGVAVDPGCGPRGDQLAREVELACDAAGHACRVAPGGRGAERTAVVACESEARWTLEARGERGARLWTVALDGARGGRLRTAAMWIARAERDAPPPNAPVIALAPPPPAPRSSSPSSPSKAREPTAAAPTKEPTSEAPKVTAVLAAPPSEPRDRASTAREASTHRGGVALAARGSIAGGLAPGAVGGDARVAFGLPQRLNAGLVVIADRAVGASAGYALTTARLGAALGWGAPWTDDGILGASIDAGPVLGLVDAPAAVTPVARAYLDAYAQLSVVARAGAASALRPWIAVSIAALAAPVRVSEGAHEVATLPQASGAVDVGVAWAAW